MDKTRTIGQKWLTNELDLHFLTLKKCTQSQSNRSILSKVIVLKNYKYTDRQTHSRQSFFWVQRVSKRGHLKRGGGGNILHKSNIFSDENVKIINASFMRKQKVGKVDSTMTSFRDVVSSIIKGSFRANLMPYC